MDDVQNSLLLYIAIASHVSGIGEGNIITLNGCHAKLLKLARQAGEGGFTFDFANIH